MNGTRRRILIVALVLAGLGLIAGGYYLLTRGPSDAGAAIAASGTVEAVEVILSPEISGKVAEVLVDQGDSVVPGQVLLRLDGSLLEAQKNLAAAGLAAAQAGLGSARSALSTAQTQYRQVLESALLAEAAGRTADWAATEPVDFGVPPWYFTKAEQIAALEAEAAAAAAALDAAQRELQLLLNDPAYAGIAAAEKALAQAQARFLTARDALLRAQGANANADLLDAAQTQYDDAKQALADARKAYDDLLGTQQGEALLAARAKVQAAQERYHAALDRLARLHTGEDSYAVQIADAAVRQAEAAVAQAEKAVAQAQAQLDSVTVQIGKLTVYAPSAGTILRRNVEPGETAVAGSGALILGQLGRLTITVYIPENRYGEIRLGQSVSITADSFPGRTFTGSVTRIADQAEFTPRNVQTQEGRSTTVFAVEITVENPDSDLKPGMPADVVFG
jgi:HlyD family secretion protein